MPQPNEMTEAATYELTFNPDSGKGKLIEGKILRPESYSFTAAVDLLTQDYVVALTMAPSDGDPVYSEPVVVFVKFELVESFIRGLLAAQGSVAADECKGGTV
jgi:hypothetical protein